MKKLNSVILLFTLATIDAPPVAVDGYLIERAKGFEGELETSSVSDVSDASCDGWCSPWSRGEPARTPGRRSPQ
jgi:hypothetical protein